MARRNVRALRYPGVATNVNSCVGDRRQGDRLREELGATPGSGFRAPGSGESTTVNPSRLPPRDLVTSGLAPRDLGRISRVSRLGRYLAPRSREVISRCASREGERNQASVRLTPRRPSYYISWSLYKNSLKFLTSVWCLCYLWYLPRY
jgi:hypothetical protein